MIDSQVEKNSLKLKKLREIMDKLKFKDDVDFAKAIEISQGYLSEIFNGKKLVPKTMGPRLRKFLNINDYWFDENRGEMFSKARGLDSNISIEYQDYQEFLNEENANYRKTTNPCSEKDKLITVLEKNLNDKDSIIHKSELLIEEKDKVILMLEERILEYQKKISPDSKEMGSKRESKSSGRPNP